MSNKKTFIVFAVIINIIFTVFLSVNVWADTPAGDEQATISNYLPDALILLDLSGSMAQNPAGDATYFYGSDTSCVANTTACNNPSDQYYTYSFDSTCTPDTTGLLCPGSPGTTYIYGADQTCTANSNAGACVSGATSTYYYAYDQSCTANSKCTSKGGTTCSGGFCNGTGQGNCVTNCKNSSGNYGYCSGGFCGVKKTGCNTDCNCQNGMCHSGSNPNCSNSCYTNHCNNGFCQDTNQSDCQTDCSKLAIAKRSLFSILDDDNSGTIDVNDAVSLGVRIGYMRYYNCSSDVSTTNYTSGCNQLIDVISALGSNAQTSYQLIYCGNSTSCASTVNSCGPDASRCIAGEQASGGTPLASALKAAKSYLDTHKANDIYGACRQKFVILLTDGSDTYGCSGNGSDCQSKMYARRRETVAATKQLADAGYKVFVVGFGSQMPMYLQNTLNWMAWYGGTDNPLLSNLGSKTAYNLPLGCTSGCNTIPTSTTCCCDVSANPTACYPSGINSCQTDSSTITNSDCGSSTTNFQATNNDPGYLNLSGYAFLAGDSNTLTAALKSAINTIKAATYSFTHAAIQAQRTTSENYIYEASFEPLTTDPFWIGHLKRFGLAANTSGNINATADWDAGAVLQAVVDDGVSSPRNIYTTNGTSSTLQQFASTNSNLTDAMFNVATDAAKNSIIKFIRRGDYAYYTGNAFQNWKLGDILHSSPVVIPTPNSNFYDQVDQSSPKAYATYASGNQRTSDATGTRIIIVGANDGQLHAFKTYDGSEVWSIIPPNLLSQLSLITHASHPTAENHTYFVDGPIGAAEVWIPSSGAGTIGSTSKSPGDWHTYLTLSEGRGGISTLWSSSVNCNSGFSPTGNYSSTYNYYCGYYTFDITNTLAAPTFKWLLGGPSGLSATDAPYLGQPWSRMFFGRVRINNNEKWVGLIGGGCAGTNCTSVAPTDLRGKGFFVVDLSNGAILWRYTYANNSRMVYNLVAEPLGVDSDNDGFMDTVYIGDLGGNVWRFKFCLQSDGASCNTTANPGWTGGLLFNNH
jgi:Neisseria PilC beta-propeller domain/von Willebrand factor type A domain